MKRILGAVTLMLLPLAGCHFGHRAPFHRVMVVAGPALAGVTQSQRAGLRLILEDLAETSGATILSAPPEAGAPPPGVLQISLAGTLGGSGLRLQARLQAQGLPERDVVPADPDPRMQLIQILASAGLHSPASDAILPGSADNLLPLAQVSALAGEGGDEESRAAEGPAGSLAAQEPRCALASLAHAQSIYRRLLTRPAGMDEQVVCANAFETALNLLPGYPRAARDAGRFYTDIGNQRQALDLLFKAATRWPKSSGLWSSMAYAARTTGLLKGAREALRQKNRLDSLLGSRDALPDTTYLYSGDWARFDDSLGSGPGGRPAPVRDFYRGYLRLLQGRRGEALTNFRSAARPQTDAQFPALAKVYQLSLEGHPHEALLALRDLALARQALRVPDGEFTFKLAEAFGYLGAKEKAMDTAQIAFSQGFGCTTWYEKTPLLTSLHQLPRWRALDSHLKQRMTLLESQFPSKSFGETAP